MSLVRSIILDTSIEKNNILDLYLSNSIRLPVKRIFENKKHKHKKHNVKTIFYCQEILHISWYSDFFSISFKLWFLNWLTFFERIYDIVCLISSRCHPFREIFCSLNINQKSIVITEDQFYYFRKPSHRWYCQVRRIMIIRRITRS